MSWKRSVTLSLLLFLSVSCYRFLGAGRDDTFIFLWAGETLGQSSWFVNYNMEPQEIISSYIVPIVIKLLHSLSPEGIYFTLRISGIFVSLISLLLVWLFRHNLFKTSPDSASALVICMSALSPALQYWSSGGMETPYHVLSYTLLLIAVARCRLEKPALADYVRINAVLVLFILARVDGFLAIPMTAAFLFLEKSDPSWTRRLAIVTPGAVAFGLTLLLRLYMTGAIWPNTVLAKSSSSMENFSAGLHYLFDAYSSSWLAVLQGVSFIMAVLLVVLDYGSSILARKRLALPIPFRFLVFLISLQNVFCMLVGGNWMEYYRFWAPTIILQNCLVLYLAQWAWNRVKSRYDKHTVLGTLAVISILLLTAEQQRDRGLNELWAPNIQGQSKPLSTDFFSTSLADYGRKTLLLNGSSSRDLEALLPFIRDHLPRYLRRDRPLRVVSYQAGFFPFMLRKYYSPDQILFFDLVGLATLDVARLDVPKNFIGVVWGTDMQKVFSGHAGALSDYVAKINPDMIYVFSGDMAMRDYFASIGFEVIYEHPQALVLSRVSDPSLGS
jgi:hypothetical protein